MADGAKEEKPKEENPKEENPKEEDPKEEKPKEEKPTDKNSEEKKAKKGKGKAKKGKGKGKKGKGKVKKEGKSASTKKDEKEKKDKPEAEPNPDAKADEPAKEEEVKIIPPVHNYTLNLLSLTTAEENALNIIMDKDEAFMKLLDSKVSILRKEIMLIRKRALMKRAEQKFKIFYRLRCIRCRNHFNVFRYALTLFDFQSRCQHCQYSVCKNCRHVQANGKVLCNVCIRYREIDHLTGGWVDLGCNRLTGTELMRISLKDKAYYLSLKRIRQKKRAIREAKAAAFVVVPQKKSRKHKHKRDKKRKDRHKDHKKKHKHRKHKKDKKKSKNKSKNARKAKRNVNVSYAPETSQADESECVLEANIGDSQCGRAKEADEPMADHGVQAQRRVRRNMHGKNQVTRKRTRSTEQHLRWQDERNDTPSPVDNTIGAQGDSNVMSTCSRFSRLEKNASRKHRDHITPELIGSGDHPPPPHHRHHHHQTSKVHAGHKSKRTTPSRRDTTKPRRKSSHMFSVDYTLNENKDARNITNDRLKIDARHYQKKASLWFSVSDCLIDEELSRTKISMSDQPTTDVPTGSQTTNVPTGSQTTAVPTGSQTTNVPTGLQTTNVPTGLQTTNVPTGLHTTAIPTGSQTTDIPTGSQTTNVSTGSQTRSYVEHTLRLSSKKSCQKEHLKADYAKIQTVIFKHQVFKYQNCMPDFTITDIARDAYKMRYIKTFNSEEDKQLECCTSLSENKCAAEGVVSNRNNRAISGLTEQTIILYDNCEDNKGETQLLHDHGVELPKATSRIEDQAVAGFKDQSFTYLTTGKNIEKLTESNQLCVIPRRKGLVSAVKGNKVLRRMKCLFTNVVDNNTSSSPVIPKVVKQDINENYRVNRVAVSGKKNAILPGSHSSRKHKNVLAEPAPEHKSSKTSKPSQEKDAGEKTAAEERKISQPRVSLGDLVRQLVREKQNNPQEQEVQPEVPVDPVDPVGQTDVVKASKECQTDKRSTFSSLFCPFCSFSIEYGYR